MRPPRVENPVFTTRIAETGEPTDWIGCLADLLIENFDRDEMKTAVEATTPQTAVKFSNERIVSSATKFSNTGL